MLHPSTFAFHAATAEQVDAMAVLREAAKTYAALLDRRLPEGPDKTYILRRVRDTAMWANVAVTRYADGTPRS